jgi:pyruvate ferredoxin oxidoreductase delta subunit
VVLKPLQYIFEGDFMKLTKGAVVEGGTSLNYKTGNWRDQRPEIDQELCNQCGKCREVCPDDAVRHNDDRYEIDYDFCKGCGICAYECKAEAIQILPEEK